MLRTRGARALVTGVGVAVAWHLWLEVQAVGKVPPDLDRAVSPRGTVDLEVTLRFPPERFHVLFLQRFGRVSGTEDDRVEVRSVPVGRVHEIARLYWVRRIVLLRD